MEPRARQVRTAGDSVAKPGADPLRARPSLHRTRFRQKRVRKPAPTRFPRARLVLAACGQSRTGQLQLLVAGMGPQVAAEVGHGERDAPPLAGVDQTLLHQRVACGRQGLGLAAEQGGHG